MKQSFITAGLVLAGFVLLNQFGPTRELLNGGNRYFN